MRHYRVYTLDRDGRISLAQDVACRDDLDALDEGKKVCADNNVEVWEGGRLVARIKQGDAPLTAEDRYSL